MKVWCTMVSGVIAAMAMSAGLSGCASMPVAGGEDPKDCECTPVAIETLLGFGRKVTCTLDFKGQKMQYDYIEGKFQDGGTYRLVFGTIGTVNGVYGLDRPKTAVDGNSAALDYGACTTNGHAVYHLRGGWMGAQLDPAPAGQGGDGGGAGVVAQPLVLYPIRWQLAFARGLSTGANSSRYYACSVPRADGTGRYDLCFSEHGNIRVGTYKSKDPNETLNLASAWHARFITFNAQPDVERTETPAEGDVASDGFVSAAREFVDLVLKRHEGGAGCPAPGAP